MKMIPIAMPIAQIAPITESMFVLSFSVIVAMMSAKNSENMLAPKSGSSEKKNASPMPPYAPCAMPPAMKVILFITTSEPIMPHIMLTKMPAIKAFCIKFNSKISLIFSL